jgi:hypothetical protein
MSEIHCSVTILKKSTLFVSVNKEKCSAMGDASRRPPPKVTDAILHDTDQLAAVISELELYSRSLVTNFEATTKQIRQALADRGAIAAQAIAVLAASQGEVDAILSGSYAQLDGIIAAVESLLPEFDALDAINSELVLLSDILTTVEEAVQRRQ